MAHNLTTKTISEPVNTDDVAAVLGSGSHDVGTLCSHPDINPASVCKPIRYNTPASLSDEQRMGEAIDQSHGIYYGVKMGLMESRIDGLHGCNYEYQRVSPGENWCRLDDFVGYNHKAVFNPRGSVDSVGIIDGAGELSIYINYNENHSEPMGIDVAKLFAKIYSSDASARDLKNWYPYVMITLGTTDYITALRRDSDKNASKLYNSGWVQHWIAPTASLPGAVAGQTAAVTVFFVKQHIGSCATSWVKRTDLGDLITNIRPFTCPDAVNIPVKLQKLTPAVAKGTVTSYTSGGKFTVSFQWQDDRVVGNQYSFYCEWYPKYTKEVVANVSATQTAPADITGPNQSFMLSGNNLIVGNPTPGLYVAHWKVTRNDIVHSEGNIDLTVS